MKTLSKLSVLIFCSMILFSCNSNNSASKSNDAGDADSLTIEHKLGKAEFVGHPKKIVVFDIGSMETLHELGVKPVGIPKKFTPTYLSDWKDDSSIEDVGTLLEPNMEKINSLSPDLILISARQEKMFDELSKIAPTVYVGLDNKNYISSFEANTKMIGELVGKEDLAKEKLDSVEAKIERAKAQLAKFDKKGLVALHNNGKFTVYGSGSRFGFIHDVLGVKQVMKNINSEATHGQKISNEFILENNPDYLLIVDRNQAVKGTASNKSEIENQLIQQTNAYKNKHIVYLDPEVWYLSGGGLISVDRMTDEIVTFLK